MPAIKSNGVCHITGPRLKESPRRVAPPPPATMVDGGTDAAGNVLAAAPAGETGKVAGFAALFRSLAAKPVPSLSCFFACAAAFFACKVFSSPLSQLA